jgi:ligand-binding sensor domain-containing protein/DNA-binding CsgD family transcriptional regulator
MISAWFAVELAQARVFVPVGANRGVEARVVPALLFDGRGYLWIGSREGLYRFDGHETRPFLPESGVFDSVSDIDIRALYESMDGTLWIGTNTGGLNRYDAATGTFEHYRNDPSDPDSIPDSGISAISEGPEGALWVAHGRGLSRLDRGADKFAHFSPDPGLADALPDAPATALHNGTNGALWVGTAAGGVARWNPQSRNFSRFDLARLTRGPAERNTVLSLLEDEEGNLWCGTRGGLIRLQPHAGRADKIDLADSGSQPVVIPSLMIDADGRLWAASLDHGLLIVNRDTLARVSAVAEEARTDRSLPGDALMSLAMARGQVFVGTWGRGVYRAPLHGSPFELFDMRSTRGLNNNVITSVMSGRTPGAPWLGSYGGGPQHVDIAARTVTEVPGRLHQIRESGALSLAGPVAGRMYAGTTHGLYEFSDDATQMALFSHVSDAPQGIGPGYVTALLADGDSGLWLGLGGSGLQYFDAASQSFSRYRFESVAAESAGATFVTALLQDAGGRIWVGTRANGLNRCRSDTGSCERVGDYDGDEAGLGHLHVAALYLDGRGHLWVGTDGGGLKQVLLDAGEVTGFRHWTTEHGLLDNGILAIQGDQDDSLWLSSRLGLSRLQPATGRVENHVPASGLPAEHFNPNASAADDSHLYFGSTDGLLIFHKGTPWRTREDPAICITSVALMGQNGRQQVSEWREGPLRLPYGRIFSIRLAVMDFTESSHQYAYRLQPSEAWTELGTQRQLIIHNLEPGTYSFEARGRDAYGLWGQTEPLALEIIPPFWMTAWFRALILMALLALALIVHFTRQSVLKRRANAMLMLGEQREKALEEQLGDAAELSVLTPRQKEILQLIAKGHSTRETAELLGVSGKTVEAHRANLMERLDIHDVPGLVRLAIRARLVSMDG